MTEKERLILAIEKLNEEKRQILLSKEYQLGNKLIKTKDCIKKFQILKMKKYLEDLHKSKIERKRFQNVKEKGLINFEKSVEDKRIVVYTCITGNYDGIMEPLYYNDNVEYVLYTDSKDLKSTEWKILNIPDNIQKQYDNVLINRYIKMHPHELFSNYDYAIYIDGNIRTVSDISSFINMVDNKTGLAMHRHYVRNCIYLEAEVCKLIKKGNPKNIDRQMQTYKDEGFPKEYGMVECNVIVSDLKNEYAKKILHNWWEEFLKSESKRDQLSLPYVLWKLGYNIKDIGNLGSNVRKNNKLEVVNHK